MATLTLGNETWDANTGAHSLVYYVSFGDGETISNVGTDIYLSNGLPNSYIAPGVVTPGVGTTITVTIPANKTKTGTELNVVVDKDGAKTKLTSSISADIILDHPLEYSTAIYGWTPISNADIIDTYIGVGDYDGIAGNDTYERAKDEEGNPASDTKGNPIFIAPNGKRIVQKYDGEENPVNDTYGNPIYVYEESGEDFISEDGRSLIHIEGDTGYVLYYTNDDIARFLCGYFKSTYTKGFSRQYTKDSQSGLDEIKLKYDTHRQPITGFYIASETVKYADGSIVPGHDDDDISYTVNYGVITGATFTVWANGGGTVETSVSLITYDRAENSDEVSLIVSAKDKTAPVWITTDDASLQASKWHGSAYSESVDTQQVISRNITISWGGAKEVGADSSIGVYFSTFLLGYHLTLTVRNNDAFVEGRGYWITADGTVYREYMVNGGVTAVREGVSATEGGKFSWTFKDVLYGDVSWSVTAYDAAGNASTVKSGSIAKDNDNPGFAPGAQLTFSNLSWFQDGSVWYEKANLAWNEATDADTGIAYYEVHRGNKVYARVYVNYQYDAVTGQERIGDEDGNNKYIIRRYSETQYGSYTDTLTDNLSINIQEKNSEDSYTYKVTVYDRAGNKSPDALSATLYTDTKPPVFNESPVCDWDKDTGIMTLSWTRAVDRANSDTNALASEGVSYTAALSAVIDGIPTPYYLTVKKDPEGYLLDAEDHRITELEPPPVDPDDYVKDVNDLTTDAGRSKVVYQLSKLQEDAVVFTVVRNTDYPVKIGIDQIELEDTQKISSLKWTVYATDRLGNKSSDSGEANSIVDSAPPEYHDQEVSDPEFVYNSGNYNIKIKNVLDPLSDGENGVGIDPNSITYYYKNASATSWSVLPKDTTSDQRFDTATNSLIFNGMSYPNTYEWKIVAKDYFGHSVEYSTAIEHDMTPPVVEDHFVQEQDVTDPAVYTMKITGLLQDTEQGSKSLTDGDGSGIDTTTVEVRYRVKESGVLWEAADVADYTIGTDTITITGDFAQKYEFSIYAADKFGNPLNFGEHVFNVDSDIWAPKFELTQTPDENTKGWYKTGVQFTIEPEADTNPVKSPVTYSVVNVETEAPIAITDDQFTLNVSGTYLLTATDAAGNSTSKEIVVQIDNVAPGAPEVSTDPASLDEWTKKVTLTVTNAVAPEGQAPQHVKYSVDGGTNWTTVEEGYSFDITKNISGDNLWIKIVDDAENETPVENVWKGTISKIDNIAPVVSISAPDEGKDPEHWTKNNFQITLTDTSADGSENKSKVTFYVADSETGAGVKVNDDPVVGATGTQYTMSDYGTYWFYAVDEANNTSTDRVSFTAYIDKEEPGAPVVVPDPALTEWTKSVTVTVSGFAPEPTELGKSPEHAEYSVDGGSNWTSVVGNTFVISENIADDNLWIRIVDAATNATTDENVWKGTISKIDNVAPVVLISEPSTATETWTNSDITIKLSDTSADGSENKSKVTFYVADSETGAGVKVNDDPVVGATGTQYTMSDYGTYWFYAVDEANNTSTARVSFAAYIDKDDPVTPTVTYNDAWTSGSVTVTVSGFAPAPTEPGRSPEHVEYLRSGDTEWTSVVGDTFVITTNVAELKVKIVDAAENESDEWTGTISNIDNVKPVVSISDPSTAAETWTNSDITIKLSDTSADGSENKSKVTFYVADSETGAGVKVNQTPVVGTEGYEYTLSAYGTYWFYAVDEANNESTERQSFTAYIDKIDPTVTGNAAYTYAASTTVAVDKSDYALYALGHFKRKLTINLAGMGYSDEITNLESATYTLNYATYDSVFAGTHTNPNMKPEDVTADPQGTTDIIIWSYQNQSLPVSITVTDKAGNSTTKEFADAAAWGTEDQWAPHFGEGEDRAISSNWHMADVQGVQALVRDITFSWKPAMDNGTSTPDKPYSSGMLGYKLSIDVYAGQHDASSTTLAPGSANPDHYDYWIVAAGQTEEGKVYKIVVDNGNVSAVDTGKTVEYKDGKISLDFKDVQAGVVKWQVTAYDAAGNSISTPALYSANQQTATVVPPSAYIVESDTTKPEWTAPNLTISNQAWVVTPGVYENQTATISWNAANDTESGIARYVVTRNGNNYAIFNAATVYAWHNENGTVYTLVSEGADGTEVFDTADLAAEGATAGGDPSGTATDGDKSSITYGGDVYTRYTTGDVIGYYNLIKIGEAGTTAVRNLALDVMEKNSANPYVYQVTVSDRIGNSQASDSISLYGDTVGPVFGQAPVLPAYDTANHPAKIGVMWTEAQDTVAENTNAVPSDVAYYNVSLTVKINENTTKVYYVAENAGGYYLSPVLEDRAKILPPVSDVPLWISVVENDILDYDSNQKITDIFWTVDAYDNCGNKNNVQMDSNHRPDTAAPSLTGDLTQEMVEFNPDSYTVKVTGLSAKLKDDEDGIGINWNTVAVKYREVTDSPAAWSTLDPVVYDPVNDSFTLAGLSYGTKYEFSVSAKDYFGNTLSFGTEVIPVVKDTVSPVLQIVSDPADANDKWKKTDVTLTFNDTAGAGSPVTYYKADADGAEGTEIVSPVEFEDNGIYSFWYYAKDKEGNRSAYQQFTVKIDKDQPAAPDISQYDPMLPVQSLDVTLTVTQPAEGSPVTGHYQLNIGEEPGAVVDFVGSVTITINQEDAHLYYWSTNKAGTSSGDPLEAVFPIDVTPPDKPVITPSTTEITNEDVILSASFDPLANKNEYSLDYKKTWKTYTSGVSVSENQRVWFRSTDLAGNVSDAYYDVTNIDKVAPTVTASANITDPTNQNVTVTAVFSADSVTKEYSFDNQAWTAYTAPIVMSENGTVYFRASDAIGNVGSTSYVVSNIDKVPPTAPVITPSTTQITNQNVVLSVNFDPTANKNEYSLDSMKTWKTYTSGVSVPGNQRVWFRSTDPAGNVSSAYYDVTNIDKVPPTAPLVDPNFKNTRIYGSTELPVTFAADSIRNEYSFDNVTWSKWPAGGLYVSGNGMVYLRSYDQAGNKSQTNYDVTNWYPDSGRPGKVASTMSLKDYKASFNWSQPGLSNQKSPIYCYELNINGDTRYIYAPNRKYAEEMDLGTYSWKIRAIDVDGNNSEWSEEQSFTVADVTPPTVKITETSVAGYNVGVAWVGYDAKGSIKSYEVLLDGNHMQTVSAETTGTTLNLNPGYIGKHTIAVYAYDGVNYSKMSKKSVKIEDVTAPTKVSGLAAALDNPKYKAALSWSAVEVDVNRVKNYEVLLDGGKTKKTSKTTLNVSKLSIGTHTFQVTAYSKTGVASQVSDPYSFYVADVTAPKTASIKAKVQNNNVMLSWNAVKDNDISGYASRYELWDVGNNVKLQTYQSGESLSYGATLDQGVYLFQVLAYDAANNRSISKIKQVTVKTPLVSASSSGSNGYLAAL